MGFKPNIVLFARHFPPLISGGARRPYFLVKALEDLGCQVFVVAPALPDGISGVVVPHVQPEAMSESTSKPKFRDFLRDWLLWPDPDIRWTKRACMVAKDALPFNPDWVITTSPPESIHWAGRRFSRFFGCYWLADFRDNWLVHPFRAQRKNYLRSFFERIIAKNFLRHPDLAIGVNQRIVEEVTALGMDTDKVDILPHFAVDDHSETWSFAKDTVNIVHTGSFSLSDPECRIEPALKVFASAVKKKPDLHLHLIGRLGALELKAVQECEATSHISCYEPVSLAKSLAMQRAADGLLVVASDTASTPPGKVFEYAATGVPIIAITNAGWEDSYNQGQNPVERMIGLKKAEEIIAPDPASGFSAKAAALQIIAMMQDVRVRTN